MGKLAQNRLKMEVKESLKSKERYRWYTEIERMKKRGWSVQSACKELRISRSEYYYWHRRVQEKMDCMRSGARLTADMFKSLSKAPHYSPKTTPYHIVELIKKVRKKTNGGAEYIRYHLLTKYQINISSTGIYKTLKREGMIRTRKYHQKKKKYIVERNYRPGDKIQIDTKHVKTATGKTYYQFGAIDVATGIIFKALYENIDPRSACSFLRDAVNFFPIPHQDHTNRQWY